MEREHRYRLLIPLLLPAGIVGAGLLVVFLGSRILLEVPSRVAAPVALVVALAVLLAAAYVAAAPRIPRWQAYGLVVGPLVLLAGGGLFALVRGGGEEAAHGPAAAVAAQGRWEVVARDNRFDKRELAVVAGQEFTIAMKNSGAAPHNVRILERRGGANIAVTSPEVIAAGQSGSLKATISQPGRYYFQCDFHATEMTGTLTVVAAESSPESYY